MGWARIHIEQSGVVAHHVATQKNRYHQAGDSRCKQPNVRVRIFQESFVVSEIFRTLFGIANLHELVMIDVIIWRIARVNLRHDGVRESPVVDVAIRDVKKGVA